MSRQLYLDWLRGLAVVLMIQTHVMNAWTSPEAQTGKLWSYFKLSGGAAAPLFLFLAGVSLALAMRAGASRGLGTVEITTKALRRAVWLLGIAILIRLWFFFATGARSLPILLRIDVLHCMAGALAIAALAGARAARGRWNVLPFALGLLVAAATPLVDALWPQVWEQNLPYAILWGTRPVSLFPLFPWAGFTLIGVGAGTLWSSGRDAAETRRIMLASGAAGVALTVVGFGLWAMRWSPYPVVEPWRTGPPYFLVRIGILFCLATVAWWCHARWPVRGWSLVRQLGTTSLLVYWAHLEITYGQVARPVMGRLSIREAFSAFLVLTAAMLLLSIARTQLSAWWKRLRESRRTTHA